MLEKIYLGVLPFIVIADIYIYLLFIKRYSKKPTVAIAWFLPSIILIVGGYFYFISESLRDFRGEFIIIFLVITVSKLVFSISSFVDILLRRFLKKPIYFFTVMGIIAAIVTAGIFLYGCIYGKEQFTVNRIEYFSPNLPQSFDGYKIVQISDLHIGNWKGNTEAIQKVVGMINDLEPDAVMITGDLVHNRADELDGFEEILSSISAKDGVFSILGNHDYGLYRRWSNKEDREANFQDLLKRQATMGWTLLKDEHTFIYHGNDSIAIIGVENEGRPPFPSYGNLDKAMQGTENTAFKVLLSHDPSHWRLEVLDTDIDLMLAGHTHGTQFSIGPFSPAAAMYKEWGGMYQEGNQALYVNVGIAYVLLPFRFGAWPEITEITLRTEK